jgi:hypothetical protein
MWLYVNEIIRALKIVFSWSVKFFWNSSSGINTSSYSSLSCKQ